MEMDRQTPAPHQLIALSNNPVEGGKLQRQCACGNHIVAGGECAECRKKRLQRKATNHTEPETVPPIIHEVLRSPGQPLDPATRAFMEPRFGHDFSQVRVHTDGKASESAQAVNALAYTVGQHVVFGSGKFAPHSTAGRSLLAHELTHTVQQRGAAASLQPKLVIEQPDSPHETEASRVAASVLQNRQVPQIGATPLGLSRQVAESHSSETREQCRGRFSTRIPFPTATAPTGRYTVSGVERVSDHERRVRISTGQRYLIRRNPWTTTEEVSASRGSVTPGIDREQVWLDVEFCRGSTEGTIRVGANVPEQAIQMVLRAISSGGDVAGAWRQASITPNASGTIRVGQWQVDLSARATVSSGGNVTGGGGEVSVGTNTPGGRVTVGGNVESQQGGVQGGVFIRWQPGGSRPAPRCTRQRVRSGFTYECREERDVAPETRSGTQRVTTTDRHVYNVFFRYAVPDFDEPRNRQTWPDLASDLSTGSVFQVTRIEGWASPEGPLAPGPRFMGNEELSRRRAEAARTQITTLCTSGDCFAPGAEVVGLGERLTPTDESGQPQDVSGRELEEHVDQTFATDPGEASVRTPALMERLRRTRGARARAELIYPQLRRAIITLRRSSTRTDPCTYVIPGYTEEAYLPNCPEAIQQAAFPSNPSSR